MSKTIPQRQQSLNRLLSGPSQKSDDPAVVTCSDWVCAFKGRARHTSPGQGPGEGSACHDKLTYLSVVNVKPTKGKCSPEKPEWEPGGSMSCTRTQVQVRSTFEQTGGRRGERHQTVKPRARSKDRGAFENAGSAESPTWVLAGFPRVPDSTSRVMQLRVSSAFDDDNGTG